MAKIFHLAQHHSAPPSKRNTFRSTASPAALSRSEKRKKYSAGTTPHAIQLETAGGVTPAMEAVTAVPPIALTNAAAVSSDLAMPLHNSELLNWSRAQNSGIARDGGEAKIGAMPLSNRFVKIRLKATREALGLSPSEIADILGVRRNAWTQYESPKYKERLTVEVAVLMREHFRIPLDWIFCGDASALPRDLHKKIARLVREAA